MAHEIFGKRFVGVREAAWHGLGTVISDPIPAVEALKVAGIDYQYVTSPLFVETPDGRSTAVDNRQAILRSPTEDDPQWKVLGTSSHDYTFLSNEELAKGLDSIGEATGWTLESLGALKDGASIFMTLFTGDREVKGDQLKSYVLVSDAKVSGQALSISITPVRVVCQNTLVAAMSRAEMSVKIHHASNVADEYAFWTGLVPQLEKRQDEVFESLDALASTPITRDDADEVINAVYPLPEKTNKHIILEGLQMVPDNMAESFEYWTNYAVSHRKAAHELLDRFNDSNEQGGETDNSQIAGTAYAVLQAVTELVDWGGSSTAPSGSGIFGGKAKLKKTAWAKAASLI